MDPRNGAILALANWPRVDANDPGGAPDVRAPGPRRPAQLRAGLDLQGVHGRRARSRSGLITPDTPFDLPPEIQVADRTIGEAHDARLRDADASRRSWPSRRTSARSKIGLQARARTRFDRWVRALRLRRSRPASTCPASSAASCSHAEAVLGLLDRQPADRPGHRGHADPDGAAYTAIANGGVMRRARTSSPGDRAARRSA